MQAVIRVEALTKTYRSGWIRRRVLQALKGLTLEVGRGEVFGLLGPNGAGKTTFIKILLGIIRPTSGTASVLDHPAGSRRGRREIGYLPENLRIPRHHTGYTALAYYGQLSGLTAAQAKRRAAELLPVVGLETRAGDYIAQYSKGMLQRLGLAQALLHDPQLVILDEPTDGLDPSGRSQVRIVLSDLRAAGKTIFLNSHILQEVELVCDRVAILDQGSLRTIGPVSEVKAQVAAGLAGPGSAGAGSAWDVQLELVGHPQAILDALREAQVQTSETLPDGLVRVHVRLPDQAGVDRLIDQLRSRSVSVISLAPRRISLEDAFLALVQPSEAT